MQPDYNDRAAEFNHGAPGMPATRSDPRAEDGPAADCPVQPGASASKSGQCQCVDMALSAR